MTAAQRKHLTRVGLIGLGLALVVFVLDLAGVLLPFHRWLYDQQVRHNQWFSPPPTDQIVHLDIDDTTLRMVGNWNSPAWRRAEIGRIFDEVARAGPTVIGADVIFAEPQGQRQRKQPGGQVVEVNDDEALAASLARLPYSAIPFSYKLRPSRSAAEARALELLGADLELSRPELIEQLDAAGFDRNTFGQKVLDKYLDLKRAAMNQRIDQQLDDGASGFKALRAVLLPRTGQLVTGSLELRMLEVQYQHMQAVHALRRLGRDDASSVPAAIPAVINLAPVAPIAQAITVTGFIDSSIDDDGVLRHMPLWVEHDGVLYPQFGFALALAALGVEPRQVRIERHRMVIPRPDGTSTVIPVRRLSDAKRVFAQRMLIPWFGPIDDWTAMYNRPSEQVGRPDEAPTLQHTPVNQVYQVLVKLDRVAESHHSIDAAMRVILDSKEPGVTRLGIAPDLWAEYVQSPLGPKNHDDRRLRIARTLQELADSGYEEELQDIPAEEMEDRDRIIRDQLLGASNVLRTVPDEIDKLREAIEQERAELREKLGGRAVLLGWTATAGFSDTVRTPLHSECPGAVVHGVIFNAVMTGNVWTLAPPWISWVSTLLIGLATAALATLLAPTRAMVTAALLGACCFFVNAILLFDYANIVVYAAGPLVAVAAVWSGCTLGRFIAERTERTRITRRFSSYVDPVLVNYIVEHPEAAQLEGQMRELTVVFTDLAGFTTLSEKLREKTVALLNEYMGAVVPVIRAHDGYVNKFLGDGIMFFYGAPLENTNHAADAIATVLDLQEQMVDFNKRLASRGLPHLKTRAGVSTGPMVVGDAGPSDASDYTVLGDCVNLGARLESANKATGTLTLVTDRTIELAEGQFLVRPIGNLLVVGKTEGVFVYEPLAYADQATAEQRTLAELTHEMVAARNDGDRQRCRKAIDRLEKHAGSGLLTRLYRDIVDSDDGFEGPIVLTSK